MIWAVTNLAAILGVVMMPSLCVAGVLTHPCGGTESTGSEPDCGNEHGTESGHEPNCAADPCRNPVPKPEGKDNGLAASVQHLTTLGGLVPNYAAPAVALPRLSCQASSLPLNLPHPPSLLPLLL